MKSQLIQANMFLQTGQTAQGEDIIDQLLRTGQITFQYPQSFENQSKAEISQQDTQGSSMYQTSQEAMKYGAFSQPSQGVYNGFFYSQEQE